MDFCTRCLGDELVVEIACEFYIQDFTCPCELNSLTIRFSVYPVAIGIIWVPHLHSDRVVCIDGAKELKLACPCLTEYLIFRHFALIGFKNYHFYLAVFADRGPQTADRVPRTADRVPLIALRVPLFVFAVIGTRYAVRELLFANCYIHVCAHQVFDRLSGGFR